MNYLASLSDDILTILFPRVCYACGDHLVRNEELICTACRVAIPKTGFHIARDNFVEKLFWGRCRLERAAAYAYYTKGGRMSRLIYKFKYDGIRDIGYELGRIYGHSLLASDFLEGIDIIVPVPLHPKKEQKRGFNQSLIIAEGVSSVTGIAVENGILLRECLTETQTIRSRIERWKNVEGIFSISNIESLRNRHVLLIDDVITTGSTIDACSTALCNVEGVMVSALALAVAPG